MFRALLCPSSGEQTMQRTACGVCLVVLAAVVQSWDTSSVHCMKVGIRICTALQMHAIRHWIHSDLPSTASALSNLRKPFRLYITALGCTVPMPHDKPAASLCGILKHRATAPICHRKTIPALQV